MRSNFLLAVAAATATFAAECPSRQTDGKACGGTDPDEATCNTYPACCWNTATSKCMDNAQRMDTNFVLSTIQNVFKNTNLTSFGEKTDESSNFHESSASTLDRSTARGLTMLRSQPLFGQQMNNPFAFQQQQQTSWFGNTFNNVGGGSMFGMGGQQNMMFNQMQGMLGRLPTCPVNVPLCKREPCQPDNPALDGDAYSCMAVKGCCFDMNLHLYKSFFGAYMNTPTCYRAVKSQLYYHYVNNINPWLPEYSESVAAKLKTFDNESPEQWGLIEQCPYNRQTIIPLASQILQRFTSSATSMYQQPQYQAQMRAQQQQMMMTMAMTGGGMNDLAGMMAGGNPLLAFASLSSGDGLVDLGMKVVKALSSDFGWKGIDRYECRMYGGCWVANREVDDGVNGRCVKAFKMSDWTDDQMFVQAVSTALSYDDLVTTDTGTTGGSSSGSGGDISGLFRTFSLGTQFNQGFNQMGMAGMNGMTGMNGMGMTGMNGVGMNGMGMTGMGMTGMNGLGLNQAMLSNPALVGAGMGMNMMGGAAGLDMSNPTNMAAMMQLQASNQAATGDSSVSDFLQNQLEAQKMQFVQQWADQKNPAVCPAVQQEKRQSCGEFTGDINRDMNVCHAKGCCFDAMMWSSAKKASEETNQQQTSRNSPFRTSTTSGGRPSFVRGRRSANLGRSLSVLPNPVAPFGGLGLEICTWNNPHDQLLGLASLKDVIQPCCERVFCYQAESDSSWASWSQWSGCSASCGTGARQRSRDCLRDGVTVEPSRCKGNDVDQQQCNNNACPFMHSWSQWSPCSVSCGQGQATRQRQCSQPGLCNEQAYETRNCNNGGCFSQWSEWSECTKPCGNGRTNRNRYCLDVELPCNGALEENRYCNSNFCEGWTEFAAVGGCQSTGALQCGTGRQLFERQCVAEVGVSCEDYANCNQNAPGCQGVSTRSQTCQLPACPTWSSWGTWSQCDGNQQVRSRQCNNGMPTDCPGNADETKTCWSANSWNGGNNNGFNNFGRNVDDGWWNWSAWSGCQGGQRYRQRQCRLGAGRCTGAATTYEGCTNTGWGFNNPTFQNQMFGNIFG
jgi:hypothetical protein